MHTKTPMNLENITSDTKSHLAYDSMYMKCPEQTDLQTESDDVAKGWGEGRDEV